MPESGGRHAYLILAHERFDQLRSLLALLDDIRNDIFIHFDARIAVPDDIAGACRQATLSVLPDRMRVVWGTEDIFLAELKLLAAATWTPHVYYHLLSGVDLPLRTQAEIRAKCGPEAAAAGIQFIGFDRLEDYSDRIRLHHWLQRWVRKRDPENPPPWTAILPQLAVRAIDKTLIGAQRLLRVDRLRGTGLAKVEKGSNWFSITQDFAAHLVERRAFLERIVRHTILCDEVVLQTILVNSPFDHPRYHEPGFPGSLRTVFWKDARPVTLTTEHYDALMASGGLFARKFDDRVDADVIRRIRDELLAREGRA